jgi:uncharacterized cupredoxin-like copper-binding protein
MPMRRMAKSLASAEEKPSNAFFNLYDGDFKEKAPAGGAMQPAKVRTNFSATALWLPALVSGPDGKVSESTTAGEVGDVEVGKTKTGTLNLTAGTYEVVCNIKDHYMLGMHATLTVT